MAKYEINLSAAIYKIHAGHHDQVMPSCGHYETRGRNGQCTLKTKRGNVTSFLGGVPNVSLPKKKTFHLANNWATERPPQILLWHVLEHACIMEDNGEEMRWGSEVDLTRGRICSSGSWAWASKSWCRQGTSKHLQSQLQLIKARYKQIFTIEITIDKRKVQAAIHN